MLKKKAVILMILSVVAFTVMNGLVKYLTSFNVYQIVFFRSLGTLLFTIPITINQKISFFGTKKKLLLLRAIFGVISISCFFESLHYLGVGTAVSLRYTSPIFAAFFAMIFLRERIKKIQWFFFVLAFFGVLLIKGYGLEVNVIGLFLILVSALFLGLIFVVIRKIGSSEHPIVIINYFMVLALIFGGVFSIKNWTTPSSNEFILLFGIGVCGFIGQFFMTKAFQNYQTSVIASIKYLEVVFSILIGIFWFQEMFNWYSLLGIILIFAGILYSIFFKRN